MSLKVRPFLRMKVRPSKACSMSSNIRFKLKCQQIFCVNLLICNCMWYSFFVWICYECDFVTSMLNVLPVLLNEITVTNSEKCFANCIWILFYQLPFYLKWSLLFVWYVTHISIPCSLCSSCDTPFIYLSLEAVSVFVWYITHISIPWSSICLCMIRHSYIYPLKKCLHPCHAVSVRLFFMPSWLL